MLNQNSTPVDPLSGARKVVDKIKHEQAEKEAKPMVNDKNPNAIKPAQMAGMIQVSNEVAAIYSQTANVGTENLGGQSLPQLKLVQTRSKDLLEDGTKPTPGTWYYSLTKESFIKPVISIISVSKGYYSRAVDQNGEEKQRADGTYETKFNQLVSGVLLDSMQPFVFFATGIKWKPTIDFLATLRPLTKRKVSPIPMYAFKVRLENEMHESENFQPKFTTVKNAEGFVELVNDVEDIKFLLVSIEKMQEMVESFIFRAEVDRATGAYVNDRDGDVSGPQAEDITPAEEPLEVTKEAQEKFNAVAKAADESIITEEPSADDILF